MAKPFRENKLILSDIWRLYLFYSRMSITVVSKYSVGVNTCRQELEFPPGPYALRKQASVLTLPLSSISPPNLFGGPLWRSYYSLTVLDRITNSLEMNILYAPEG